MISVIAGVLWTSNNLELPYMKSRCSEHKHVSSLATHTNIPFHVIQRNETNTANVGNCYV